MRWPSCAGLWRQAQRSPGSAVNMTEAMLCCVCHEPLEEAASAVCNSCGRRYHLRLRQDQEGKDCGQVWLHQEFLTLEFGCFLCLGQASSPGQGAEPPLGGDH